MSAEVKDLIRKRGVIKGRLTNFINYTEKLDNLTSVQVIELQVRLNKIDSLYDQFEEIQSAIECSIVDERDRTAHLAERTEFENLFYAHVAVAQEILNANKPAKNDNHSSSASYVSGDGDEQILGKAEHASTRGIKLPTIQIPRFSGQYEEWLEFHDLFVSLIHESTSISDIQKFHYLRASLEGAAAQVVKSLEFSARNYKIAWDLLCDRYDNKRLLVQNHIQALFALEPTKRESYQSLRKIIDTFAKNLRALDTLGEPTASWDTLIIYIMSTKLDARTLREWEEYKSDTKTIKLKQFTSFLKNRADLLETLHMSNNNTNLIARAEKYKSAEQYKGFAGVTHTNQTQYTLHKYSCPLCKQNHRIYRCDRFLGQSVNERAESVRKLKLCENCLRPGHQARVCRLGPCMKCSQRHNTVLHPDTAPQSNEATIVGATSLSVEPTGRVLLSTAVIHMYDRDNHRHEVKALLDSGSQASFMTDSLLHKLNLKHTQVQSSVVGINNTVSKITKRCNAFIESRTNSYKTHVSFLILPNIATLCNSQVSVPKLNIPSHVVLADPEYFNPSSIDILLGADIFWDLLEHGQIRLGQSCPILQRTKLGYVVSGPTSGLTYNHSNSSNTVTCNLIADNTIQEQLAKFWSLEEVPDNSKLVYSVEERLCEKNFVENCTRMPDGRFSVAVPLKRPESCLGDSFERARQCLLSLERRLHKQPKLKQMYIDFMSEYIQLGHMTETQPNIQVDTQPFFLPHHGVLRDHSTTTKLRVVFNASAATSSGVSYNDLQMVGPTIQSDLLSILLRFRHYPYVLTGDIEKMYRQVLIHENQRHLQQILWRDDPNQELKLYKLNTVTYGTASAPFLAIRSLKQLALECEDPQISQIISDDFYVDDLVTGSQTKEQLKKIKEGVCQVLSTGCFNLRKIRSNIQLSQSDSCQTLNLGDQGLSNTLGLGWSPTDDQLYYTIKPPVDQHPTKRSILSAIGQIYDPLGLLIVCVIQAKILLQKLWLLKLSWDEPLPLNIIKLWHKFTSDLHHVVDLRIPRCVINDDPSSVIEIHTFCDSSQDAYGACLYVRSEGNGQVDVKLLCAKSKVAPLKPTTIPRLELCGALVAARLTEKVLKSFRIPVSRCVLWTDSSIVLGWLQTQPNKLKQFVKNRVAEIQELTINHEWSHVPTALNPADMLSRGINISELHEQSNWWTGPDFLKDNKSNWPQNNFIKNNLEMPEVITTATVSIQTTDSLIDYERFSKLLKLQRALAYTLRFIYNCRNPNNKRSGPLTTEEIQKAFLILIKSSQQQSFEEYSTLLKKQSLPNKNKLLNLSPFIDESEIIRVGGRLENSKFNYNKKHPILLSSKHTLTKLIFVDEHIRLMHAGPQLLLSSIRDQFWPIGGRTLARSVAHKCLRCFRMRAQTANPIMGHLPEQRLDPGYTFQTTGVDYAGPLLAADRRGRGCKLIKVYVVVFVCFATKCLHLELVSSLTKEAYIAALHRFIARRGKPEIIFSDNGTNFVGAKNEINAFLKQNSSSISEFMANEFIKFKFSPAYAPHFGGLWEAGVKSFKHHLTRVLGDSHLTFEELYTVLVKIEAILNSRPLSPMSSDPSDLSPLTPGHFLVRRPLTALPVPSLENRNPTRLQRWHRVEQIHQHFWARWHKEYVSELQLKTKWRSCKGSLDSGTMVIIKEDAVPPMKWSLGRIVKVHPGVDGISRVADIRTSKGTIRRAFNRICPLPLENISVESQDFQRRGACRES